MRLDFSVCKVGLIVELFSGTASSVVSNEQIVFAVYLLVTTIPTLARGFWSMKSRTN